MRPPPLFAAGLLALACAAPEAGKVGETPPPIALEVRAAAGEPADELPLEPLDEEGVRGGRIVYTLPGSPDEVLEMLTDFDNATGRRVWAKEYRIVERREDGWLVHLVLEGRAGIRPQCDVEYELRRPSPGALVLEYRLAAPTLGLAAFFGDHWLEPGDGGGETLVSSRIYIDSGLPFVNATAEDIEAGLRADVTQMRMWMSERLER